MTLLSNEENKEISLSSELSQASTEKVGDITERLACDNSPSFFAPGPSCATRAEGEEGRLFSQLHRAWMLIFSLLWLLP